MEEVSESSVNTEMEVEVDSSSSATFTDTVTDETTAEIVLELELKDLVDALHEFTLPKRWNSNCKITYGNLEKIFAVADDLKKTNDEIIEFLCLLCGSQVKQIIKKLSNVRRKVKNALVKSLTENKYKIFSEFYVEKEEQMICTPVLSESGITKDLLLSITDFLKGNIKELPKFKPLTLTNELMIELSCMRTKLSATLKDFCGWVKALSGVSHEVDVSNLSHKVNTLLKYKTSLSKSKVEKVKWSTFSKTEFILPNTDTQKPLSRKFDSLLEDDKSKVLGKEFASECRRAVTELLAVVQESEEQILKLTDALKDETLVRSKSEEECETLRSKLQRMATLVEKKDQALQEKINTISKFNVRNVNKRIKTRDDKIEKLRVEKEEIKNQLMVAQDEMINKEESIAHLERECADIHQELDKALTAKLREQKMKSYYKSQLKISRSQQDNSCYRSKIDELNQQIKNLENEKVVIEEKMEEFMATREVKTFKDGKYTDDIRMLYQDLLCMGVSANMVSSVIRKVMEKLGDVDCERLPSATFSKYMLLKARGVSQLQVAHELLDKYEKGNHTLHTDGTSKKGYGYVTADVVKGDGKVLCCGVREIAAGDAETQMNVVVKVFKDCVGIMDKGKGKEGSSKIITSIKNLMSDRCIVQKKFNSLFKEYREGILPNVIEDWQKLSEQDQSQLKNVNQFFCGLHFLVGLADQAEATLKVWDTLCWGTRKVGSLAHGGYSKGESGTMRLVRTVCKAVQERGSEQSGRMVQFKTFLENEHPDRNFKGMHLAPFLGNRFNILFYNAAGVFNLYDYLKVFSDRVNGENKLLSAVHYDLKVVSYMVGCRALRVIEKLVTGPLWRIIEKESHILDMNKHYQNLLSKFETWAEDAGIFLAGTNSPFEGDFIIKDDVYDCLMQGGSEGREFWDTMTKQCLELIFSGFVVITKRLLFDHLKGGALDGKENDEKFRKESSSASLTNAQPERDFGMIDHLMKSRPKASTIALEGLIMCINNKTSSWRDQLTPEKKAMVMELARKSKKMQRDKYLRRKEKIKLRRADRMAEAIELKERKEMEARQIREKLTKSLENDGGLWQSKKDMEQNLRGCKSEAEKRGKLKTQIKFREKVLLMKHENKSLFHMSSGGKQFTSVQLKSNLLSLIEKAHVEADQFEEIVEENFESQPVVISKEEFLKAKLDLKEKAAKTDDKNKGKRKQKKKKGKSSK